METTIDELTIFMLVLLVAFFLLLMGSAIWMRIERFREKFRYLNMELRRCSEKERPKWLQRRRKLWLWLFCLRR